MQGLTPFSTGTYSLGGHVTECTPCKANQEQPAQGQSNCSPCSYLQFSAEGSSTCQQCFSAPQNDPVCPLNPYTGNQTENLVSETFESQGLRSFERDESGDFELSGTLVIPLETEDKPFYINSVVLMISGVNFVSLNARMTEWHSLNGRIFFQIKFQYPHHPSFCCLCIP